ncbi:uncharacterized protein LOC116212135 [Punica granatum]|uniref:Uncharacterized protein LOC116212135 n=1 Tax=Punica granatum TaxID=22663 RepID=A0A6P8E7S8_PUNGR|nr:uncharacterized protein LOC116212135 [Punica granatum]
MVAERVVGLVAEVTRVAATVESFWEAVGLSFHPVSIFTRPPPPPSSFIFTSRSPLLRLADQPKTNPRAATLRPSTATSTRPRDSRALDPRAVDLEVSASLCASKIEGESTDLSPFPTSDHLPAADWLSLIEFCFLVWHWRLWAEFSKLEAIALLVKGFGRGEAVLRCLVLLLKTVQYRIMSTHGLGCASFFVEYQGNLRKTF